jgi:hypothetical protein
MVSSKININNGLSPLPLNGAAVTLLLHIKRHTSLEKAQLRTETQATLDDPNVFESCFDLLVKSEWIEPGGAGWRTTKKGEDWLEIATDSVSTEDEAQGINDQPKKPYDVAKLKVEQRTLSVFQALRKIEKQEIIMNPDFQRAFVWDVVRQSRLIESILIRIPLPAFYLDATDLVKWTVVDGLQRLTTLNRYCRTQDFALTGLEFLTELDGLRFNKLPQKYKVLIEDDTQLIFNNLLPGTPIEAKFTIFSRVNTGGMQLTPQEIRHALNQGPITGLLQRLSSSREFLEGTDWAVPSRRMADQELILRSLSFLHFGWKSYQDFAELDTFLVRTMLRFNSEMADKELSRLGADLLLSVSKVKSIFRNYAFRKFYERGGRRGPINKALFEVWTVCVHAYDNEILMRQREVIIDGFLDLMNTDVEFNKSITSGTGSFRAVKTRFERISKLLSEASEANA